MEQQVEVMTTETFERAAEYSADLCGSAGSKTSILQSGLREKWNDGYFYNSGQKESVHRKNSFSYYQTVSKIVFIDDTGYVDQVLGNWLIMKRRITCCLI